MKISSNLLASTILGIGLIASAATVHADARSDQYPASPITLVVPFSAGGGVDVVGRILAKSLSTELGASIVVENKPGASGMIGASYVAHAKPDGLTLLLASSGEVAINPHLYKDMNYSPEKDLAPISLVSRIPNLLSVNPQLPIKNVGELVAYAKAHPDTLSYSSSGVGNIQNITGELLNSMAGIHILHVPYKGSAQAVADVAGGQVSMTFASGAASLPFIESGKIRPIGVTSDKPMKAFPDVPPIKDTPELKDFLLVNWFGLFTTAGTPDSIVQKLNAATVKALANPEVVKALESQGADPAPMSPQAFADFRADQSKLFGQIIRDAHIAIK
ncbi:tripartite tricarboxylate transporter substrate binding protein [Allopusillimonas soli]|uniref:Tripartite tricarboxylate transporter substrate binding protein n=2 Tax=Allopusillimonas soli TaxID=659016 RepID=A0A853FC09_9BURK|nr:tripartite tricarboxylate transporter substrate binding protein [Allopusillimonas soli]NYT37449.1 tripartite tricarboxylate transporter substrate binding protein [Allopusillimonas soli]TEA74570.1 tripartite tricarboxylate transporter substrate binding protein [Allopusillimonas soli]